MRQRNYIYPSQGFTLTELIIAIVVATSLVMAVSIVITNLATLNKRARDIALSNAAAENKIEALRSAGYVTLSDATVDFTDELPDELNKPNTATYTVSGVADGLKKVEVDITYNDQGETRVISYSSYIGELGVGQY